MTDTPKTILFARIFKTALALAFVVTLISNCGGGGGGASDSPAGSALTAGDGAADTTSGEAKLMTGEPEEPVLADGGPITSMAAPSCPPPAGASANNTINAYYKPANAFDGDMNTWWVGSTATTDWDLYYDLSTTFTVASVSALFYSASYTPTTTTLKVSTDGCTWTTVGAMTGGATLSASPAQSARYLWIEMSGAPATGYPLIRDVDWVEPRMNDGASGGPGVNDAWYYPAKAFDGDPNTWWVGEVGAGAWNLYYVVPGNQHLVQMVTADLFNANYRPTSMKLYVGNYGGFNGVQWTEVGEMGPGASPSQYYEYNTANYIKIEMTGNPPSNFPVIKDISFDIPLGASSGDSLNAFYKPANAFDANPDTWWVGAQGQTEWNLIYQFATDTSYTTASIAFYAASHAPATTEIYTSLDGYSWTSTLTFPTGANPTLNLYSVPFRYVRFKMSGAPSVGYPLIKDITFGQQSNAWVEFSPGSASGTGVYGGTDVINPDIAVSPLSCEAHVAYQLNSFGFGVEHWYWNNAGWTYYGPLTPVIVSTSDSPPSLSVIENLVGDVYPTCAVTDNSDVNSYRYENTMWLTTGAESPSTNVPGTASNPSLKDYAYMTWEQDGSVLFSEIGGMSMTWEGTNTNQAYDTLSGTGASNPVTAIGDSGYGNNTRFVAWSDTSGGNENIYLVYNNGATLSLGAWQEFPGGTASGGGVSNTTAASTVPQVIAISATEVIVVWQQAGSVGGNTDIFAARCNTTTGCTALNGGSAGGVSNDSVASTDPTVTLDPSGNIVVAWIADNKDIYVKRYNASLSVWEEMGTGSATGGGVSGTGTASSPAFADDPDSAHCGTYLIWSDGTVGNRKIYLKKFQP